MKTKTVAFDYGKLLDNFIAQEPHRPTAIIAKKFYEWSIENNKDLLASTQSTILEFMVKNRRRQTLGNIGSVTHGVNSVLSYMAGILGGSHTTIHAPLPQEDGYMEQESGSIYITETEYERIRDQMTACARDRLFFILSWHMIEAIDIAEMKRTDVTVTGDEVRIKDKVIKDRELALAVLENNNADTLYIEGKDGIVKRRPLIPSDKLLWVSNRKSSPKNISYNLPNVAYTMNTIMLRGKKVDKAIPLRNVRISKAALLYHQHFQRFRNLSWWAEEMGVSRDYSIKARQVARMLYGA